VAAAPFSGLNHAVFGGFAVLKCSFQAPEAMHGELWFGHTGEASLYLNNKKVYEGNHEDAYHRSKQPFQVDAHMLKCTFQKGLNNIVIAVQQKSVFWSFSIRPRTALGLPIESD
jgi:hypothetical protein